MTDDENGIPSQRGKMMDWLKQLAADARTERFISFCLYLIMAFPVLDYTLRRLPGLSLVGAVWDQALLLVLIPAILFRSLKRDSGLWPAFLPFLMLCLAYGVRNLHYLGVTIEGLRAILQWIPYLFIAFHLVRDREQSVHLVQFFLLVTAVVAGIGLLQPFLGVETPAGWIDATEMISIRIFSIVQSPNVLGAHLALAIPIALGMAWYERRRLYQGIWGAIALMGSMALVLTFSRGAWLALAGAAVIVSAVLDRRLLIALLIAAVLLTVMLPQVTDRVLNVFSEEYLSKSLQDGRVGRWLRAYDLLRNQPLFGLGPGQYGGAVAARHFGISYLDNYYAKTAAELGLLGLGVYLAWLGAVMKKAVIGVWGRAPRRFHRLQYGVLGGLIAVLLHNGVENIFEVPYMNTYFWFLAGLMVFWCSTQSRGGSPCD